MELGEVMGEAGSRQPASNRPSPATPTWCVFKNYNTAPTFQKPQTHASLFFVVASAWGAAHAFAGDRMGF